LGVQLGDIVPKQKVELDELRGRTIAIDAMNALYQFLSIIRQRDGTPLKDSQERVTSHLSGLFYRTANLIEIGIKPVYVFDGEPPALKSGTIENRRTIRAEAARAYKSALKEGDMVEARKQAQRAVKMTADMIGQSQSLLDNMGVAWVQAPGEGEAQAARLVQKGDAWAAGSQDFDSLLFGAKLLVRNVAITGRRKMPGKSVYVEVSPEVMDLDKLLEDLEITREQLVAMGVLMGTDFNKGVKGIGPKTALKLIREHKSLEKVISETGAQFEVDPLEVEKIFLEPNVTDDYVVKHANPDPEGIKDMLCEEHDFSESRVQSGIDKLSKGVSEQAQKSLENWFG